AAGTGPRGGSGPHPQATRRVPGAVAGRLRRRRSPGGLPRPGRRGAESGALARFRPGGQGGGARDLRPPDRRRPVPPPTAAFRGGGQPPLLSTRAATSGADATRGGRAVAALGRLGVAGRQLRRTRGFRHVRDHLRGEPGPDTDIDARRLGRSPAAEGLQRRRRSGPIQGKQQGDMTDTRDDQRSEDQKTVDIWATGTEEPPFDPTDEGSQEMGFDETQERLAEQFGRVISDDYMYEEEQLDDERMLLNMGPQHPSTHGVLRLQV